MNVASATIVSSRAQADGVYTETAKGFLDCPYRPEWARFGCGSCAEALAEMERLKVENRDLRRVFEQATVAFREKEAEIKGLKDEIEVLRRKLRDKLQEPFTRNTDKEENAVNQEQPATAQTEQSQNERKKRGAPKGHRGATRKKPARPPDRTILVNPCQCPKCQSKNISVCKETEEHTQEDLILPLPIITRYLSCQRQIRLMAEKSAAIAVIAARSSSQRGQANVPMVISALCRWPWPGLCGM